MRRSGNAAATAYVLDATEPAPAWRQVASMANPRAFQNTTLLPDGTVLVTGGGTALDGLNTNKAVLAPELGQFRSCHVFCNVRTGQAINLEIAIVAEHNPLLRIGHHHALVEIVQGGTDEGIAAQA